MLSFKLPKFAQMISENLCKKAQNREKTVEPVEHETIE